MSQPLPASENATKKPIWPWIAGCGCLAALLLAVLVVAGVVGVNYFSGEGMPLAPRKTPGTATLETLRLIDSAKDQYAIEHNKNSTVTPTPADLAPYVKPGTPLHEQLSAGQPPADELGAPLIISPIDTPPQVSPATKAALSVVLRGRADDFFGEYK